MLLRDLVLRRGCCWPSLLLHCALHPLWGFVQNVQGLVQVLGGVASIAEWVQWSLMTTLTGRPPGAENGAASSCVRPRRAHLATPSSTSCPAEESWWSGLVIVIAVCCASLLFLTVLVIICYKAIKRKPLRKEENGTSVAEYPMTTSQSNKGVDVNNAMV
ncbi:Proline-rich membrane anchor 1 [Myotis brandtii]|uniref:Proline-rich membrane anchor 1 n=1 Tax=Myotis brandtii TaxID=109478 RepID=S7NCB2_MYOBR|nr:Proline-rich membrane anchor 1 [Myotis brandtii]